MKIEILGNPIPQKRPEVRFFNGRAMGYDPSAPQKKVVIEELLWTTKKHKIFKDIPLKAILNAFMPIPKSLSDKKRNELNGKPHIKRIDIDNIMKFYFDCMEGIVYERDECICQVLSKKEYSFNPRVEIEIIPLESQ